jgi:hypothetical protein
MGPTGGGGTLTDQELAAVGVREPPRHAGAFFPGPRPHGLPGDSNGRRHGAARGRTGAAQVRLRRTTGTQTAQVKARAHDVKVQAGKTYAIDLESKQFNAYLVVQDAQGKTLAENDDIVPNVNLNSRLLFTAPTDGTYRLVATSFEGRGSGAYTLTITEWKKASAD